MSKSKLLTVKIKFFYRILLKEVTLWYKSGIIFYFKFSKYFGLKPLLRPFTHECM